MIEGSVVAQAREWAQANPRKALALTLELMGSVYEICPEGTTRADALFWAITWAGVGHATYEAEGGL